MPNYIPKSITIERVQNGFIVCAIDTRDQTTCSSHREGYVFNTPEELGKAIATLFAHGDILPRPPCCIPDGRLSDFHCSCGSTCYTDGTENWCPNEKCPHCCVKMPNVEGGAS